MLLLGNVILRLYVIKFIVLFNFCSQVKNNFLRQQKKNKLDVKRPRSAIIETDQPSVHFFFFFKQTWDISMVFICLQFLRYIYSQVTLAKQICLLEILSPTLKES